MNYIFAISIVLIFREKKNRATFVIYIINFTCIQVTAINF